MALDNLVSVTFTPQEVADLHNAISAIENIMASKGVNLTPTQRKSHARVRYEMEVWINKVASYLQTNPKLKPAFLDQAEYQKDLAAHNILNPLIDRTEAALQSLLDTNLLLGTDLYNNSILFYRNLKTAAQANVPGASAVFADLKQQFPGPGITAVKEKTEQQ